MCNMIVDIGLTFDLGSARMFSTSVFETYFSYHKVMWIAVHCAQLIITYTFTYLCYRH